jgi:hypothetical protein
MYILYTKSTREPFLFCLDRGYIGYPLQQGKILLGLNYCGGKIMTVPATDTDRVVKLWEEFGLAAVVFGTGWSEEIHK